MIKVKLLRNKFDEANQIKKEKKIPVQVTFIHIYNQVNRFCCFQCNFCEQKI